MCAKRALAPAQLCHDVVCDAGDRAQAFDDLADCGLLVIMGSHWTGTAQTRWGSLNIDDELCYNIQILAGLHPTVHGQTRWEGLPCPTQSNGSRHYEAGPFVVVAAGPKASRRPARGARLVPDVIGVVYESAYRRRITLPLQETSFTLQKLLR